MEKRGRRCGCEAGRKNSKVSKTDLGAEGKLGLVCRIMRKSKFQSSPEVKDRKGQLVPR